MLDLKKVIRQEKTKQNSSNSVSRRKEIVKIEAEIDQIQTRKTMQGHELKQ